MKDTWLLVGGSLAVALALLSLVVLGAGILYAILYSGYMIARWCASG